MAKGEDPAQRADAIARLAADERMEGTALRKTLENALSDDDPSVRAQAVYGLARREGAGAAAILQEALHDSDASVRLMAVDSAGTDAQGAALLQEALADKDETVRVLAATKLESLSKTEVLE
jgi:HEAT repeat protein